MVYTVVCFKTNILMLVIFVAISSFTNVDIASCFSCCSAGFVVIFFNGYSLCFLWSCYVCKLLCCLELHQKLRFRESKPGLSPFILFLQTVPRRLQFFFGHLWFHMWRLFCPHLFLLSHSFGTSVGLCFVILAFPGYLHLYYCIKSSVERY